MFYCIQKYVARTILKHIWNASFKISILLVVLFVITAYKVTMRRTLPTELKGQDKTFEAERFGLHSRHIEKKVYIKDEGRHNEDLKIRGSSDTLTRGSKSNRKLDIKDELIITNKSYFKISRRVKNVDCDALFSGSIEEVQRVKQLKNISPNERHTNHTEQLMTTKKCSEFITNRGYIMSPLTETEMEFPIAFSLLMFKDTEQAERLFRAIYRPQNVYCIHVDAKSPRSVFDTMSAIVNCFDNAFMATERVAVKWGRMSVLEPELICMKELMKRSKSWTYFINLTGQEFPLRTNYELVRILRLYNGSNDVSCTTERQTQRWKDAGPPPHGIVPYKGSVHVAVSRGFVNFTLNDKRARDLLTWTRKTKIPDETFFSTLNHNPFLAVPGSYKGVPRTDSFNKPFVARFKIWPRSESICYGKRVRTICVFGIDDLPLLSTRKELFANKFHLNYQPHALDCMEELIFNRTRDEYMGEMNFDSKWYSTLGFISNKII